MSSDEEARDTMEVDDEENRRAAGSRMKLYVTEVRRHEDGDDEQIAEQRIVSKQTRETEDEEESIDIGYDEQQYQAVKNMRREANCPRTIGPIGSKVNLMQTDMLNRDSRLNQCEVNINYREKLVITTTFDIDTLVCRRCTRGHNALVSTGYRGERQPTVIFLTDQDHPPYIESEQCIPSIRVEDGNLHELTRLLSRLAKDTRLPSGTVVYMSSLSQMERIGAAGYAEEVVAAIGRLEFEFNGHIRPIMGLPALENSVTNPSLIRHVHDVIAWAMEVDKKAKYHLEKSSNRYLDQTIYEEAAKSSEMAEADTPLQLPVSMRTTERVNMM
ncbi:MAG: hypothetical protein FJ333_09370, partial [Sphingomonadales bacterium]|nr:hypothetical protein [Sphingomonadales bacterium]